MKMTKKREKDDEDRWELTPKGCLCDRLPVGEVTDILNALLAQALAQNLDADGLAAIMFDDGQWVFAKVKIVGE